MQELAAILETLRVLKEPAALATLVRARGSSYRKPGARMVFGPQGPRRGLISAGCLETDVLARVESVLAGARPQLAVYDMGSELDLVWGTGMGCEGKVEVMLERVEPGQPAPWMVRAGELLAHRRIGVLGTVFEVRGEAPLQPAERLLASSEAEAVLPADPGWRALFLAEAEKALARGKAAPATLRCGEAEVEILFEPLLPDHALWVFGAGEHGRPISRLAKQLGWFVGIVDHRPALATRERFPDVDRIVVGHPRETLAGLPFDSRSAALVISHVYEKDKEALEILLDAPLAYLGLQGNRQRCARLVGEVTAARPLAEAQRRRLFAPAGLDIGGEGPEAIALSMLAEVQAVLTGYAGGHLRDRTGRIRD